MFVIVIFVAHFRIMIGTAHTVIADVAVRTKTGGQVGLPVVVEGFRKLFGRAAYMKIASFIIWISFRRNAARNA